jgi:hypothetical protein
MHGLRLPERDGDSFTTLRPRVAQQQAREEAYDRGDYD